MLGLNNFFNAKRINSTILTEQTNREQTNREQTNIKQTNIKQTNIKQTNREQTSDFYRTDMLERYKKTTFNKKSKYCAVCIENRFLPIMYIIVNQLKRFLNEDWCIILFVSKDVYDKYVEIFINSNIKIHIIEEDIYDVITYNKYLLTNKLWNRLNKYERVLIFQSDTMIYRYGIEHFLEYDYVGAPWPSNLNITPRVGNGGFSLRNPLACIECIKRKNEVIIPNYAQYEDNLKLLDGEHPEDIFFSQAMHTLGYKIPDPYISQFFSIETCEFNKKTIGSHKLDVFNNALSNTLYLKSVVPYFIYNPPDIKGHRFGWKFVLDNLKDKFNNFNGVYLNTWMDCNYLFNDPKHNKSHSDFLENRKWVGISHLTEISQKIYFQECNIYLLLKNEFFIKDLKTCAGIFTLSNHTKPTLEKILLCLGYSHIKVNVLYHPISFESKEFDISNITNVNTVVSIGCQLRRITTIFKLNTTYRKIWLPGKNTDEYLKILSNEMKEFNINITKDEMKNVDIYKLTNESYDELLRKSFVIIDIYEASANNAIVECIATNTPCFVRKHPAIEEYIGKDYPLFFESIEELEYKLKDIELITSAYYYLKNNTILKKRIEINSFINNILNSDITKSILS